MSPYNAGYVCLASWKKCCLLKKKRVLTDHRFMHNFQDCLYPICSCGQRIETTTYFLLHCPNFHCAWQTFFEKVNSINSNVLSQNGVSLTKDLVLDSQMIKWWKWLKNILIIVCNRFNPFSTKVPLLYPKTSENRRFSDVLGYRSGTLVEIGLIVSVKRFKSPLFHIKLVSHNGT